MFSRNLFTRWKVVNRQNCWALCLSLIIVIITVSIVSMMPLCIVNQLNLGHWRAADLLIYYLTLGKIRLDKKNVLLIWKISALLYIFLFLSRLWLWFLWPVEHFCPVFRTTKLCVVKVLWKTIWIFFPPVSRRYKVQAEFLQWSFVPHYSTHSFPRHLIVMPFSSIPSFQTFWAEQLNDSVTRSASI